MLTHTKLLLCLFILLPTIVFSTGCGNCGFECDKDNSASLSLGINTSASDDIKSVTLEIDAITFRRTDADDVVVNKFTIKEKNITDAETAQIELLDYRGLQQLIVVKDLDFEADSYTSVVLTVMDNDINRSFVKNSNDIQKELNVTGNTLVLKGITVSNQKQTFTVKFNLSQSLSYVSSSDNYRLTTQGINVLNNKNLSSISGRVDSDLFNQVTPCPAKGEPLKGNRLYLYKGKNLNTNNLADVFTASSNPAAPANSIKPFEAITPTKSSQTGLWDYAFGFLSAGDYTLAFSCNAETDDAIKYDGITIPLPNDQLYKISVSKSKASVCDLKTGAKCQ